MRLPVIKGIIDRRILVNFRVDPVVASQLLPSPFRPKLAGAWAMAGICLIRLKNIRPAGLAMAPGVGSENAAHRFAVEWEEDGELREGVFIPRRDSDSRLNALLGGRLVPGRHHHARFEVEETEDRLRVAFESDDGETRVRVAGRLADRLLGDSVFSSVEQASQFFERGSLGYSSTADANRFDGLELKCSSLTVQPLAMDVVESSFFQDQRKFPAGSAIFDCALLMRGIEHEWHTRDDLYATESAEL
jgi:Uncharacterized conserved protein (COG2071)